MMQRRSFLVLGSAAALPTALCAAPADEAAIVQRLKQEFDKPDAPLTVAPVVVQREHAVAGWIQGGRGGRALLQRRSGQWQVVLCAGDGLLDPKTLVLAGLPEADARALAQAVRQAEARLPVADRAKLSLFDGLVHMDGQGRHPPGAHGAARH